MLSGVMARCTACADRLGKRRQLRRLQQLGRDQPRQRAAELLRGLHAPQPRIFAEAGAARAQALHRARLVLVERHRLGVGHRPAAAFAVLLERAFDHRDQAARVERLGDGVDGARLLHELAADLVALGAHQAPRANSSARLWRAARDRTGSRSCAASRSRAAPSRPSRDPAARAPPGRPAPAAAENALASKMEHTTLRIVGLSSTTRIRALISAGPSIVPGGRPQGQGPLSLERCDCLATRAREIRRRGRSARARTA